MQECQEIPPRSQQDVTARVTLRSVRDQMKDVIVETQQLRPGLYVGRTLLSPNHRDLKVCVANTTNKPQVIPAGSYLGQAVPVTVMWDVEADSRFRTSNSVGPTISDESLSEINSVHIGRLAVRYHWRSKRASDQVAVRLWQFVLSMYTRRGTDDSIRLIPDKIDRYGSPFVVTPGLIMVALCNMADHYIFILWFLLLLSFFFFSSPNLRGRRLDVYHTSTHGVALV